MAYIESDSFIQSGRYFYVDTLARPPRSSWVHPLEGEQPTPKASYEKDGYQDADKGFRARDFRYSTPSSPRPQYDGDLRDEDHYRSPPSTSAQPRSRSLISPGPSVMAGPTYYIDNSRGSGKRRGIIGTLRDIAAERIEHQFRGGPGSSQGSSRQIDAQRYREAYLPEQPRVQPDVYAPRGAAYVDNYHRGQATDYYASAPQIQAQAQPAVYVTAEDQYTRGRSRRHRRRRSSSASSRSSRRGGGGLGSLAGGIIIGQSYSILLSIAGYLKHAFAHRRTPVNCSSCTRLNAAGLL